MFCAKGEGGRVWAGDQVLEGLITNPVGEIITLLLCGVAPVVLALCPSSAVFASPQEPNQESGRGQGLS